MENLASNRAQKTKAHYYRIIKGGVAYKVPEPVKNDKGEIISVARELEKGKNAGQEVHELIFNQLEGILFDVKIKEPNGQIPYQIEYHLMHEKGEVMIIQSNLYTGDTCQILQKLIGIDPNKKITFDFYGFADKESGKMKYPIVIHSGEVKMVNYFDKENPNLPKWVQKFETGPDGKQVSKGYSQTDQVNFLWNSLKTILLPNLPKLGTQTAAPVVSAAAIVEQGEYDDIPEDVVVEIQGELAAQQQEQTTAPKKTMQEAFNNVLTNPDLNGGPKTKATAPANVDAAPAAPTAPAASPAPASGAKRPRF